MKKDDQIKVLTNKLDYMEDRARKAEEKVDELKAGVEELKQASDILLTKLAVLYGPLEIPREMDLSGKKAEVELDEKRDMIIVNVKA